MTDREAEGESRPLRIGISACLLGERVRYDADHKRHSLLTVIGREIPELEWIAVCPEVDIGLGTPRPPMILRRSGEGEDGIRLLTPSTGADHTETMGRYAEARVEELAALGVAGYVLKSRSPSCGLGSTPVHESSGEREIGRGSGLFARALRDRFPEMPIVEETDVTDRRSLLSFLEEAREYAETRRVQRT